MRSPPPYMRNGESPHTPRFPAPHFQSTLSVQKLRRFNLLILVFRFAAFCFCFASAAFMVSSTRGSPHWYDYDAFRYLLAASAIVSVYSLFEMGASVWEISRGATLLPETLQIWFDFGHDQVFAYLLLSAAAAGTELSRRMKENSTCATSYALCVQTEIAIALGFAGFLFLAFSSLLSGFRVVCFIINGTRLHL